MLLLLMMFIIPLFAMEPITQIIYPCAHCDPSFPYGSKYSRDRHICNYHHQVSDKQECSLCQQEVTYNVEFSANNQNNSASTPNRYQNFFPRTHVQPTIIPILVLPLCINSFIDPSHNRTTISFAPTDPDYWKKYHWQAPSQQN